MSIPQAWQCVNARLFGQRYLACNAGCSLVVCSWRPVSCPPGLLAGRRIDAPPSQQVDVTFKKAPRAKGRRGAQPELDLR